MGYKPRNTIALMLMFLASSLMLHMVTEIRSISNQEDIIYDKVEPISVQC
jgi:hypothetical protein